jgi:hypothetical protein
MYDVPPQPTTGGPVGVGEVAGWPWRVELRTIGANLQDILTPWLREVSPPSLPLHRVAQTRGARPRRDRHLRQVKWKVCVSKRHMSRNAQRGVVEPKPRGVVLVAHHLLEVVPLWRPRFLNNPTVCLGLPCKVLNQLVVGLSPLSETTYPTGHNIPNDGSRWIFMLD